MAGPSEKDFPRDKEYELSLLLKPDPERKELRAYLGPYIKLVLNRFEMPAAAYERLYRELDNDVLIAAERYLLSPAREADYKFSAYFSWYVSDRLNAIPELTPKESRGKGGRQEPPSPSV